MSGSNTSVHEAIRSGAIAAGDRQRIANAVVGEAVRELGIAVIAIANHVAPNHRDVPAIREPFERMAAHVEALAVLHKQWSDEPRGKDAFDLFREIMMAGEQ